MKNFYPNSFYPNSLFTKATILMSSSLFAMVDTLINPDLTAIQDHFALIPNAEILVRLILTLPSLLVVIGSPIAGMIVDRLGRKPLLIIATLLYGFAGGSEFLHDSLYFILVDRLLILIFGITIFSRMIFYLIPVNLPFYLDSLHNITPPQTGVAIATCTFLSAFSSMIYGFVVTRLDKITILPPIFVFMSIVNLVIGLFNDYFFILIG